MIARLCIGICIIAGLTGAGAFAEMPQYELAYRVDGPFGGDYFGWALSRVGDVNNDGQDDLVVGAPGWGGGSCPSRVYLVAQTLQGCTTLARIDDLGGNKRLGGSVSGLSDMNGDGRPDYAAGASRGEYVVWADGADRTVGGAASTHPAVLATAYGGSDTHYFGRTVIGLSNGQLLESSRPDVSGVGTSGIWYTPALGGGVEVKLKIQARYGGRNGDPAIRNVGDIVGNDGMDDFLLATDDGGPGSSRGRVSLVSGAVSATGTALLADIETRHFDGPADETVLGDLSGLGQHPMATAGDFTGDGVMDFVFTAIRPHGGTGAAYFYDGATQQMLWELPRPAGVTRLMSNVENVGDVDGDGKADIAVSVWDSGDMSTVLFYSPVLQQYIGSIGGERVRDQFGRSVLSLGDLNGDGLGDFAIGAPGIPLDAIDIGSFYVYQSIPEPATLSLLALSGFAVMRRRRRKRRDRK